MDKRDLQAALAAAKFEFLSSIAILLLVQTVVITAVLMLSR